MRESLIERFPILELLQDSDDHELTHEAIEEAEILLGVRLPRDYSDFLLAFNGGHFSRDVEFSLEEPSRFVTGGLMWGVYGQPGNGIEIEGLVENAAILNDRLPEDCLAIADCNSQDHVVLRFANERTEFAGVWFWDSDAFWEEGAQQLHWLADTFNGFLSMLVYDITAYEGEPEALPLFQAIQRGNCHVVRRYLAEGGEVEARNAAGQTLLMAAAIYSWPRIVKLLLDRAADVNARDAKGQTPLHHAACHSVDSVKLLLAAGADAKARDGEGKSVLAQWSYRADQILRKHGAVEWQRPGDTMRESLIERFPILELLQDSHDPPLTSEAIEELGILVGVRFPQEYADFLLGFNGGDFGRDVEFSLPEPKRFVTGGLMWRFFGEPSGEAETYGLIKNAAILSDRLPDDCLAIADCNSQDHVVLRFANERTEFAGVWFWDSNAFWDEGAQQLHWLADTFNGFLSMLVYDITAYEGEPEALPLFQATQQGNFHTVRRYLADGGEVDARNAAGQTLLMAAAIYSWPRIVKLLLDRAADVNARDAKGQTPLHHAACHSVDSVKLLLTAGADAKARDGEGKSVLAQWSYRADQILRKHGAVE